ncbi:MAG: N-acetylmuramoyl-L-alanine amidase [Candidatus Eisenbacteria bacterium]|uniref:N-acetylmuramoyl-L-alanine amidase n=1 Tax=Eiseniibacteriota bacterium TaxID=2212470 RepID=A0A538U6F4_UNCEI|nr:MAG: N-acetylmuramoyl-L-alanine amidase [Candidatus Eisenbacteria bacterium]
MGRTTKGFAWLVALALIAPSIGRADSSPPVQLTGFRSWTSPTSTRVVMEFSRVVAHVAPDSGSSPSVRIAIPGEPVALAPGVPTVLQVHDGVIDSVVAAIGVDGARFHLWLRDSLRFKVFSLPAQGDQPYRVVVDVTKPGGAVAQSEKLANIATKKNKDRIRVVAVDPGHGGEDTGAKGPRGVPVLEKSVTLAVARALIDELNRIPGVRAVLTRDGDYFVPLHERYHLAERMKADVFVSIHANSSKQRGSGNGTEVYFLSLRGAGDQAESDLADRENAADLVGGVPPQTENELVNILYDVKRSSALQQSQLLAESVLDHIAADRRLESRGVKQAGFVVLKSVEFPSILVETAFINNPKEARLLKSHDFQSGIARQIADGVKEYFKKAGIDLRDDVKAGAGN